MTFNSWQYALFLPLVFLAYQLLRNNHSLRVYLLLVASYFFYMCWKPEYAVIIFVSTVIDYYVAIAMSNCSEKASRIKYLLLSLCSNLSILFFFKYYGFARSTLLAMAKSFPVALDIPELEFLLPVGISFYTFQTLSYSIDVYRGRISAERRFSIFALYVVFFPQLVAGPIERSQHMFPQFHENKRFDYSQVTYGLKLIAWGLFKKLVIADRVAAFVNIVYGSPDLFTGPFLSLATFFFAIQIYCDFSGYSDIAIGSAKLFGIDLMKNFSGPYLSRSVTEFWRRWHISLSTWFRDYLYIPLGGSRCTELRHVFNIIIVFVLSGLWHGANWTFVVWGFLNGLYLVLEKFFRKTDISDQEKPVGGYLKHGFFWAFTMLLIGFSWIFFRSDSIGQALAVISRLPYGWFSYTDNLTCHHATGFDRYDLLLSFLSICVVMLYDWHEQFGSAGRSDLCELSSQWPKLIKWSYYYGLVFVVILFGVYARSEFIYFQF